MKIVQKRIFLQYGQEGEPVSSYNTVHKSEAGMFIDLDSASGGYPYATAIERAYDFKTVGKALEYSRGFQGFHPRIVTITYDFETEQ